MSKTSYRTIYRRDGTITVWSVHRQQWLTLEAVAAYADRRLMATLSQDERARIEARATSAIRQALRAEFGPRRYRITRYGEIHVRGLMPNSNATGWWLYGWVGDTTTMQRLRKLAA